MKLAPTSPGVYRMLNAANDVLYVGKAKNVRKRLSSYARANAPLPARILRMIAATVTVEIISTTTETEALLLEANLIKQLRPRFNVLLRDDKSFPYILITGDHWAPQILKHRGAQSRPGPLFRPVRLRRRGQPHHHRAAARLPDPLLHRRLLREPHPALPALPDPPLRRPLHRRDRFPRLYRARARGDRVPVRPQPGREGSSSPARWRRPPASSNSRPPRVYRDRLAALSAIQSQQGINPRTVEEADVFAIHQEGGYSCVEVFFFRTGQNWGNRAYFPRAEKSFTPEEVLSSFLAQFYDDKPPPKLILLSHEIEEAESARRRAGGEGRPQGRGLRAQARREEGADRACADQCARGARPQARGHRDPGPAAGSARRHARNCRGAPQRIEVYDNSHIKGTNAVGAMIVAGPDGFVKNQYRKFNIKSEGLTPGDDYGMMREVLERRFKRLLDAVRRRQGESRRRSVPQWPDLVLIDGGRGQLNAAREIFQTSA